MPGTGHATLLDDIFTEFGVCYTDEVDDNPERNPHVGLVEATTSSRLAAALLAWRGGNAPDVDPFAIHIVNITGRRDDGSWNYTINHDPDCDRLPYGEQCAFDKAAQGEIPISPGTVPGEYTAWIVVAVGNQAPSEEYIRVGTSPVERLGWPPRVEPPFPGPAGTFYTDKDGDVWVTLPNGRFAEVAHSEDTDPEMIRHQYSPMTRWDGTEAGAEAAA
jgi:hypothetical protein